MERGCPQSADRRELAHVDTALETVRLAGIEPPGAELERRRGARPDRGPQRVLVRPAGLPGGQECRQQHVAAPDRRDRLDPRRDRPEAAGLAALAKEREAAASEVMITFRAPSSAIRSSAEQEVLVVVELLADERLRLPLVRRHEERLRVDAVPQRLAVAVEHRGDLTAGQLVDRVRIEVVGDAARERAGEDDELGALRQVGSFSCSISSSSGRTAGPTR